MKNVRVYCPDCKKAHLFGFSDRWINYTFKCYCGHEIFIESKVVKQYEEFVEQLKSVNDIDDFLELQ